MFDASEIGLIAIIALLVLGPERLPRAARTAGALMRKARQSWHSVQQEIERELAAEDLKRAMQETAAAADPRAHVDDALKTAHEAVREATAPLNASTQTTPDDERRDA
jgi:sec-independent protein translocase protein TatB